MNKEERFKLFKTNLLKIAEAKSPSFVIFESSNDKFVQFAGFREMGLMCDIPLAGLTKEERRRLLTLKEFSGDEGTKNTGTKELVSYQKNFSGEDIDRAVDLTERIFIKVLGCPSTYNVEGKLNLQ